MPTLTTAMTNASPAICAKPAPKNICSHNRGAQQRIHAPQPAVLDAIHFLRFALVEHIFGFEIELHAPPSSSQNRSLSVLPSARQIATHSASDGLNRPASIMPMVCRVTPTFAASSSCDRSQPTRAAFIRRFFKRFAASFYTGFRIDALYASSVISSTIFVVLALSSDTLLFSAQNKRRQLSLPPNG